MSSDEYHFDDRFVCADCFDDEGIRQFIGGMAARNDCTFCGTSTSEPTAAPFSEVVSHISQSLFQEYDDAANCMSFSSADGGYLGTTWTTQELLSDVIELELPRDADGKLRSALCSELDDNAWCERNPYNLNHFEHTKFSWDRFCRVVKHERRYFFFNSDDPDGEILSPADLLKAILSYARQVGLIARHAPGTLVLYRARHERGTERWTTPMELGPPPVERAIQPNRMSPAGVVMFYASDNIETCLRETALSQEPGKYAVGVFKSTREVRILDLANLPSMPSLFSEIPESQEYNPRPVLQFLHHVSREMAQPVARDGHEHIEYVPSQVVTEYARSQGSACEKVDGIRYKSAVHPGNVSYVLFADQENVVQLDAPALGLQIEDRWLHLTESVEHSVTEADLQQWRNEGTPAEVE